MLSRNSIVSISHSAFRDCQNLASIVFDGPPPASVHGDSFFNISPLASIKVWPEHAAAFGGQGSHWEGLPIELRESIPNDIIANATAIGSDGSTITISITGGPSTVYRCNHSPDLESFTVIPTTPATVRTNASGTATFTVELADDKGYFTFSQ